MLFDVENVELNVDRERVELAAVSLIREYLARKVRAAHLAAFWLYVSSSQPRSHVRSEPETNIGRF